MTQRIIKFRAWDIGKSEMIYDGIEYALRCLKLSEEGDFTCIGFSPSETLNFKIMQFTGLCDKNGVDIYEGDVVKYTQSKGRISKGAKFVVRHSSYWEGREFGQNPQYSGFGIGVDHSITYAFTKKGLEVVGNIYENSELLEE